VSADVNPGVNRIGIPSRIDAESARRRRDFVRGFCFAAAPVAADRRRWSQESGRGGDGTFGGQDKRTAAKVALSGCLHIEKHGTTGLADGAIVGSRWLKHLILLAWSGWQAGGTLAPSAFKPLNP